MAVCTQGERGLEPQVSLRVCKASVAAGGSVSQTCDFPGMPHPSGMRLPHRLVTSGPLFCGQAGGRGWAAWVQAEPPSRRSLTGRVQGGMEKAFR